MFSGWGTYFKMWQCTQPYRLYPEPLWHNKILPTSCSIACLSVLFVAYIYPKNRCQWSLKMSFILYFFFVVIICLHYNKKVATMIYSHYFFFTFFFLFFSASVLCSLFFYHRKLLFLAQKKSMRKKGY